MRQMGQDKKIRTLLLALGACASLVELGPIITLIRDGAGILPILIAGLSYQIGNALPHHRKLGKVAPLTAISIVSGIGLMTAPTSSVFWYTSIASLGWAMQYVRRWLASQNDNRNPTTAQKRSARVAGFIFAAVLNPTVWITLVLIAMAAALAALRTGPRPAHNPFTFEGWGHLERTMLVHQMHYFAYCYAVPRLVADIVLGGSAYIGLWFAAGWVSYLSAETLWKRFDPSIVFLIGHTFLAFVLILMWAFQPSPFASLVFWILSGFGGGSVYCITLMHRSESLDHSRLENSEDLGHLLGVVLAIGLVSFSGEVSVLPLAGGLLAIATALLMATKLVLSREQNQDGSHPNEN